MKSKQIKPTQNPLAEPVKVKKGVALVSISNIVEKHSLMDPEHWNPLI